MDSRRGTVARGSQLLCHGAGSAIGLRDLLRWLFGVLEYTAGAVYIVRDPRDVCVSAAHHFGLTIDKAIKMLATRGTRTGATLHIVGQQRLTPFGRPPLRQEN